MTSPQPSRDARPMAPFTQLVAASFRAATHRVSEGSRRNARQAVEARLELARQGVQALAALPAPPGDRAAGGVPHPRRDSD